MSEPTEREWLEGLYPDAQRGDEMLRKSDDKVRLTTETPQECEHGKDSSHELWDRTGRPRFLGHCIPGSLVSVSVLDMWMLDDELTEALSRLRKGEFQRVEVEVHRRGREGTEQG